MMQHRMSISRYLVFMSRLLLILAITSSILKQPASQAAIIRANDGSDPLAKGDISNPVEDSHELNVRLDSDSKLHKLSASRFIVLSTGSEIKLYPIHINERQSNAFETLGHYTIRPREFNISDKETVDRLGANSSFTRWLQRRASIEAARLNGFKRLSILPSPESERKGSPVSNQDDDDELYGPEWRRPLISDVDYFFDTTFCSNDSSDDSYIKQESCLVLVWLDKRNKFVRFGSINLETSPIEMLDSTSSSDLALTQAKITPSKYIYLDEFPPLDICKLASLSRSHFDGCEVTKMVVDRQRGELHCFLNSLGPPSELRVFSGQLRANLRQGDQIAGTSLISIETCPKGAGQQPAVDVKSAHFDEAGGSWMYYLDDAGRIMAFDIKLGRSQRRSRHTPKFDRIPSVTPVLVNVDRYDANSGHASTAAMALAANSIDRKIYRLTDTNELLSSDLAGMEPRLIGKLSAKPVIRMPGAMHVFHDTVFFSDLARHSIMMYKLRQADLGQRGHALADLKSTHKVLVVEMSRIQSFCLIDLNDSVEDYDESEPDATHTASRSKILSGEFSSWFERSSTRNPGADVYEQLRWRTIDPCLHPSIGIREGAPRFSTGILICLGLSILGISLIAIKLIQNRTPSAKNDGPVKYPV